jgi:hypothetical protein
VEAAVQRALEKLPENRPATAEQMRSELEQALAASRAIESGVRPHVPSDDLPESLRLAERRTWVLGALLVGSIIALFALGLTAWRRSAKMADAAPVGSAEASRIASTAAFQPAIRTVAPTSTPSAALENSVSMAAPDSSRIELDASPPKEAAAPAASAARSLRSRGGVAPAKKPAPKPSSTSPLERRGNERYGRFD